MQALADFFTQTAI
jgi:hypothetical protein